MPRSAARRHHRRGPGAGRLGPDVHPHAGRLRRRGSSRWRTPGRRLRPRLRRCGQRSRPRGALRVGQPRQGVGDPRPEVAGGHGRRCTGCWSGPTSLVSNLAPGVNGQAGPRPRRPGRAPPRTSSPSRSTATARAARCRTSAPTTCSSRPSPGRARSPVIPARRPSPDRRWPTCSTGLYAALSILALLFPERRRHRCAAPAVAVSLFDTMTERHGLPADLHPALGHRPAAARHELAGGGALRRLSAPPTGRPWCWAPPTTANGSGCAGHHGRTDLADDERFATNTGRVANRELLDEAIAAWCAQHDLAHVQEVADAAGIGNCPLQPAQRGRSRTRSWPRATAGARSTRPRPIPGPAATSGDHGIRSADGRHSRARTAHRQRLAELGLGDDDDIAALREQGAIGPAYSRRLTKIGALRCVRR